ncbi:NYN domain-containing protein [Pseudomonas taiwanensis]|uniref:LabA-like NYN domain-containing protein n=1 Tax=Pseudomonas taiwanensis TaxID=470150 RepID=UPI0028DFB5D1|nr:NYN domain-containing protein [Pseudomonas taiwanensis]MDT8924882.1 NYN domain-containing protein [Pseudomonas taiwanensis]
MSHDRVGIFVDQSNINASGGFTMDYTALRDFALRGGSRAVHMNIYTALDPVRLEKDPALAGRVQGYHSAIKAIGYNITVKLAKHFDEGDRVVVKSNVDMEIAVDVLEGAGRLDRVVILTGDGDFAPLIRAARRQGVRVEVIAVDSCSADLREAADAVFNAWLIPDLLPPQSAMDKKYAPWGQPGSRVRGTVDNIDNENKTITIRYIKPWANANELALLAPQAPMCQGVAICDLGEIPRNDHGVLRGAIVEFTLQGLLDDIGAATEVVMHRFSTRSGWYRS